MNKFDRFFINIHQWLVDKSQKKPQWWLEQCAYALAISATVRFLLGQPAPMWVKALWIFANLLMVTAFYVGSKKESTFYILSQCHTWRQINVLITLPTVMTNLLAIYFGYDPVYKGFTIIAWMADLMAFFFAACQPPAPPKRKHQTKLALDGSI